MAVVDLSEKPKPKSRLIVEFDSLGSTIITGWNPENMSPLQMIAIGHLLTMTGEDWLREISEQQATLAVNVKQ